MAIAHIMIEEYVGGELMQDHIMRYETEEIKEMFTNTELHMLLMGKTVIKLYVNGKTEIEIKYTELECYFKMNR